MHLRGRYWINFHEHHHKTCETEDDVHSPWHNGFWNVQTQDSSSRLVTTQEGVDRLFRSVAATASRGRPREGVRKKEGKSRGSESEGERE